MARDKQLKVWVDNLEAARLSVRAEEAGMSVSQYIGRLIALDGEQPDRPAPSGAVGVTGEILELNLLNAILLRTLLVRELGEAEADKLIARARVKAHGQAQAALAEGRSSKE
jgi:hypothetical protein